MRSLFTRFERIRLLSYFGASLPRVELATIQGDVERGVQFIGQAQGLVHDVPAVAELIARVVNEAEEILAGLEKSAAR